MRQKSILMLMIASALCVTATARVTECHSVEKFKKEQVATAAPVQPTEATFEFYARPEMSEVFVAVENKVYALVQNQKITPSETRTAAGRTIDRRVCAKEYLINYIILCTSGHRLIGLHIDPGLA